MSIKRAKTVTQDVYSRLLEFVGFGKHPARDSVMLSLSFKAGLRAKEIAGIRWRDVTDAEGNILPAKSWIWLPSSIVKGRREDSKFPLHEETREFLVHLQKVHPNPVGAMTLMYAPKAVSGKMTTNNVTVYLHQLYHRFGVDGCSSHSGRRTFITSLARTCNTFGCSMKDVQALARHSDIRTTEKYLDPSDNSLLMAMAL